MSSAGKRAKRFRDRIANCPVYQLDDGRRALQLWEDWRPPPLPLPNVFEWSGRFYYILTQEALTQLIVDAIGDPKASERRLSLLRRMVTELEWAEAIEMVALVRSAARPSA